MTEREFEQRLAEASGLPIGKTRNVLRTAARLVAEEVREGRPQRWSGLGTFKGATRKARKGRNVRTGAPLDIPEYKAMTFKASKSARDFVNGGAP